MWVARICGVVSSYNDVMSVLERIGAILPPPNYVRLPSAGVDISDSSLKYVQFQPDKTFGHTLKLQYWGDIDIPEGVIKRGSVNEPEKLAAVLAEVKDRTGVEYVRVSLPEEHAYLFQTEIKKGTPLKEIRGQIEFKMQDDVPLSAEEAFFDYDIFDAGLDSSVLHVSVTAYARDIVMSYYDSCLSAGVTPLTFEVEAQAIARAAIPEGDHGTHLIIDFGHTRTGVGIVHDGVLMYTSTIDIGGRVISEAIRNSFGTVSEQELTELKNKAGLVPQVEDTRVYDAILPTTESIVHEIKQRIHYWDTREANRDDRRIDDVIICGGSGNIKGFPGYLSNALGLSTARAQVWQNAFDVSQHVPSIGRRYSYGYATAIGLALISFD